MPVPGGTLQGEDEMATLEELKEKYSSALELMPQQGVQISRLTLEDNRLFVRAIAPSQDAKNAVWNQIKSIDSSYTDLVCDITVGSTAEIHQSSPQSLAGGLAEAFRSDQTPAFPQMLSSLFSNSDGQQRAGLLNQLLASAGPEVLAVLPGPLANLLKGSSSVTPEQAEQISPDSVQHLAEHAQKTNPSIIDQVSGFYSQHPKVVQALGAGALALIMSHVNKK
jgi:hypothetical protein